MAHSNGETDDASRTKLGDQNQRRENDGGLEDAAATIASNTGEPGF